MIVDDLINPDRQRRNIRTGWLVGLGALMMLGLAFASVPLYEAFCRLTGWDGTPLRWADRAVEGQWAPAVASVALPTQATSVEGRAVTPLTVRFDAHVAPGLPWLFEPSERLSTVTPGIVNLGYYRAVNLSSRSVMGQATFNVSPPSAAPYFVKIDCFCFTEQILEPGQSVDMPVTYTIDPALFDDSDTVDVDTITLSYTFFAQDP